MPYRLSRRQFLQATAYSGVALTLGSFLGGCEEIFKAIANRPTRRNILHLADTDPIVETYRDAVTAMKALPSTDGRNWNRQAQIHFDHCPHNNWFFFPWHRAYLLYFERICRELTGATPDQFALPYWHWTENAAVPPHFWGGAANPLFIPGRVVTPSDQAQASLVGPAAMDALFQQTSFVQFAGTKVAAQRDPGAPGSVELSPHNHIHGFVGGEMWTYQSPRDPVFWTHHNMIECCWVHWNLRLGNPNTNDPDWIRYSFDGNFFDKDGNSVDVDVLTTLLFPILSYQFEDCFPEAPPAEFDNDEALKDFLENGADVQVETLRRFEVRQGLDVQVGEAVRIPIAIEGDFLSSALTSGVDNRLLLSIEDVGLPRSADVFIRVFIEQPDATIETPASEDARFAGSFAFFSDADSEHGGHPLAYRVDVTEAVRRILLAGDRERKELEIDLVAVPFPGRDTPSDEFSFGVVALELTSPPRFREDR